MSHFAPRRPRPRNRCLALAGAVLLATAVCAVSLAAPSPKDEADSSRLPVPEAEALEQAVAQVRDAHREEYARSHRATQRLALGHKLLEEAAGDADHHPAFRFALLVEARKMGVELARLDLVLPAIDQMAERYETDGLAMKSEALADALAAARTTTARRAVAEACRALLEEAVLADRFAVAMECAHTAYDAADGAHDTRLRDEIVARGKQVLALRKEFARVETARQTLAQAPDDPGANLTCGRYLCLVKRDWERGLPMLALGSDPKWRSLARRDLADPSDAQAQLALGDGWWDMARAGSALARDPLLDRARRWYQAAMPRLDGSERPRVIARLAEIKGFGPPGGDAPSAETAAAREQAAGGARASSSSSSEPLAPGRWHELLPLVDPEEHAVAPGWRLVDAELEAAPSGPPARLMIPVRMEGDYDLKAELTRTDGFGTVGVILPIGPRQCLLALSYGGTASGLDTVDGRRADDNPTTFPGSLNNRRCYTLDVAVRVDGDRAAVTAKLDGRPVVFYRGPVRSLGLHDDWRLRTRDCPGLAARSPAVFHRVALKVVSGKAECTDRSTP